MLFDKKVHFFAKKRKKSVRNRPFLSYVYENAINRRLYDRRIVEENTMADKPLPTKEPELNVFIQNLVVKLPAWAGILGISPAAMTELENDALNFNYTLNISQGVTDSKEAFFEFKDVLMNGPIGTAPLPLPTFPAIATPKDPVAGIVKRLRRLIQQIKLSSAYTDQIGEDLGLVESSPASFNPNDLFAEITPRAIANGKVEITFSKQGMDAMRVEFRRKGETNWSLAGVYTSSGGIHDAPSVPPDSPEQREYRGILTKKNQDIGNMSPIYTIVTTP